MLRPSLASRQLRVLPQLRIAPRAVRFRFCFSFALVVPKSPFAARTRVCVLWTKP